MRLYRISLFALIPFLTTCSLETFPHELKIRMAYSPQTALGVTGSRSLVLADMNCFAFVFKKTGSDEVTDTMTAGLSHQCLGIEGTVSTLVDLNTAQAGVTVTLAPGTYSGEVFGFFNNSGNCSGKTLAQVFERVPNVFSIGTFPATDLKAGSEVTITSNYSSGTTADKVISCPPLSGSAILPAVDNAYVGVMPTASFFSLDWAVTSGTTVPPHWQAYNAIPLSLSNLFPYTQGYTGGANPYHTKLSVFYYYPYNNSYNTVKIVAVGGAGFVPTNANCTGGSVSPTAFEMAFWTGGAPIGQWRHGRTIGNGDSTFLQYADEPVSSYVGNYSAHGNRPQIEVAIATQAYGDASQCARFDLSQFRLEVSP